MAKITKNVRLQTGIYDGKPDYLTAGFVTEENFGGGNVQRRYWIHASLLNPVLFQQVKPFLNGASHVCLEPVDLPRGKAGPTPPVREDAAPLPELPPHGFSVPEYGQLVAHNGGDGWGLSMVHKGTGEFIYEELSWPDTWPGEVTAAQLRAQGWRVVD